MGSEKRKGMEKPKIDVNVPQGGSKPVLPFFSLKGQSSGERLHDMSALG